MPFIPKDFCKTTEEIIKLGKEQITGWADNVFSFNSIRAFESKNKYFKKCEYWNFN